MHESYSLEQLVILYSIVSTLLPLFFGALRFRSLPKEMKKIYGLSLTSFFFDLIGTAFWLLKTSNLWIGHIQTLVEFLMLSSAFRIALSGIWLQKQMKYIVALFVSAGILNTVFLQDVHQYNTYIKILEATLLIGFSLAYFYKLAKEMKVEHLEREPFFWVNTGVLIYFSSNLFVFTYSNYLLLYSQKLGIRIWFIHALFFIFFNCILAFALWIVPKNSSLRG